MWFYLGGANDQHVVRSGGEDHRVDSRVAAGGHQDSGGVATLVMNKTCL